MPERPARDGVAPSGVRLVRPTKAEPLLRIRLLGEPWPVPIHYSEVRGSLPHLTADCPECKSSAIKPELKGYAAALVAKDVACIVELTAGVLQQLEGRECRGLFLLLKRNGRRITAEFPDRPASDELRPEFDVRPCLCARPWKLTPESGKLVAWQPRRGDGPALRIYA